MSKSLCRLTLIIHGNCGRVFCKRKKMLDCAYVGGGSTKFTNWHLILLAVLKSDHSLIITYFVCLFWKAHTERFLCTYTDVLVAHIYYRRKKKPPQNLFQLKLVIVIIKVRMVNSVQELFSLLVTLFLSSIFWGCLKFRFIFLWCLKY